MEATICHHVYLICGRTYSWVICCLGYWHIQNWMWHLGMLEVTLEQMKMFLWDRQTPNDILGLAQMSIAMLCSFDQNQYQKFWDYSDMPCQLIASRAS